MEKTEIRMNGCRVTKTTAYAGRTSKDGSSLSSCYESYEISTFGKKLKIRLETRIYHPSDIVTAHASGKINNRPMEKVSASWLSCELGNPKKSALNRLLEQVGNERERHTINCLISSVNRAEREALVVAKHKGKNSRKNNQKERS